MPMLAFELSNFHESGWVYTYVVGSLLVLVALLVGSSLGLIRGALLFAEGLPALTESLADVTKGGVGVLLTNVVTLLVGEEHVGRETTLGGVGVWMGQHQCWWQQRMGRSD